MWVARPRAADPKFADVINFQHTRQQVFSSFCAKLRRRMGLPSGISPSIGFSPQSTLDPYSLLAFVPYDEKGGQATRESNVSGAPVLGARLISAPRTAKSLVARIRGCQWAGGRCQCFSGSADGERQEVLGPALASTTARDTKSSPVAVINGLRCWGYSPMRGPRSKICLA